MRRGIALALLVLLPFAYLARLASAGGGTTPGASFINCDVTEPTIASDPHTVMCDDFSRTRNTSNVVITGSAPLNPGTAAVTNCDSPPAPSVQGEQYPPNKGWCVTDSGDASQFSYGITECGGAGPNGANCAAQQLNGGSNAMSHAFPATCITGGVGCTTNGATGAKEYSEIYQRFMIKFKTGFALGADGNQKLNTLNPGGNGTGGIFFGAWGMAGVDPHGSFCPIMDCLYGGDAGYRNPQGPQDCGNGGQYLCQNVVLPRLNYLNPINHWWGVEFHYIKNTGNSRNGTFQQWSDDCGVTGTTCPATPTLRYNYTNVAFTGNCTAFLPSCAPFDSTNVLMGLFFMDVNTCCAAPSVGTVLIGQVVVSTQHIGWPGSAPSTPPAAPTNLHFGAF